MNLVKNFLALSAVPSGWVTNISAWMLLLASLLCASPTIAAALPWLDCKVVGAVGVSGALIGIRRALSK